MSEPKPTPLRFRLLHRLFPALRPRQWRAIQIREATEAEIAAAMNARKGR